MIKRRVKTMMPKGLPDDMKAEFKRVATLLADPTVDRLKPHYLDTILDYCRVKIRLRQYDDYFQGQIQREVYDPVQAANQRAIAAAQAAGLPPPAPITTRNGVQIKSHPYVAQRNESWRQWRSLVAILGLSPTDERNMAPGLGNTGDPTDKYF